MRGLPFDISLMVAEQLVVSLSNHKKILRNAGLHEVESIAKKRGKVNPVRSRKEIIFAPQKLFLGLRILLPNF